MNWWWFALAAVSILLLGSGLHAIAAALQRSANSSSDMAAALKALASAHASFENAYCHSQKGVPAMW
jgi:hypothetical protein